VDRHAAHGAARNPVRLRRRDSSCGLIYHVGAILTIPTTMGQIKHNPSMFFHKKQIFIAYEAYSNLK
jgi:hypothetical protein